MSERWSIYIDIEGFGALWEKNDRALRALGELMRGIFRLAHRCYPCEPQRLFAHQFGDGFIVLSDFHEESLERCAAIAVTLMRHVAAHSCFARAAIAEGEWSDIQGCYPNEVLSSLEGDHTIGLHMGIMTIIPVMGTALIRAVALGKRAPKGPLLIVESSKMRRLGATTPCTTIPNSDLISIDWVHMESALVTDLKTKTSLSAPSAAALENMLKGYCTINEAPEEWRKGVSDYLGLSC
jgi:hypothetical protein